MVQLATILRHNVIGKLLNHVIVFIINILLVRMLGASLSGNYFNELYLLNIIVFIFSAGLDYSAIALISRTPEVLPVIRIALLRVVLVFSVLISIYAFYVLPVSNNYFKQPGIAIVLFSIGNLLLIFYQGILSSLKKFNQQNVILVFTNLVFLGYLFYQYNRRSHITPGNIEMVYAATFIVQGILIFLLSSTPGKRTDVTVNWASFIRPGIVIMISSLVYFLFLRIDNFFVQKYADGITLSNYVQCGKIGQYFLYFSSIISSTLLPFIASESIGNSYEEWKKINRPYLLLLFVAAIAMAVSGKFMFPLLFGEAFSKMYPLMLILLPGFICLGMLTLINAVYIGKGNTGKILRGDLAGLMIVFSCDAIFVPLYGVYAAAIISSVAYCMVFLYLFAGFKKQFI